jgi:23S rRNA pseudouridine1911/1915/1917 synthase
MVKHKKSSIFCVSSKEKGKRLDLFVQFHLPHLSRSFVKKLIDKGHIRVDFKVPKKGGAILREGEEVEVSIPPFEPQDLVPEDIPLKILYEDDFIAVIHKPAALVVHPSPGHPSGTLVNALLSKVKDLSREGEPYRPGIVHRLDKDTSGVMVVAKESRAHRRLQAQFSKHSVGRRYRAILYGTLKEKSGRLETYIGRHGKDRKRMAVLKSPGRRAVTSYRVMKEHKGFSLVEFELFTGRTHQIRVHASHLGHPVVGDLLYSRRGRTIRISDRMGERKFAAERNYLHAWYLSFDHPETGEGMEFSLEDPGEFSDFWAFLDGV